MILIEEIWRESLRETKESLRETDCKLTFKLKIKVEANYSQMYFSERCSYISLRQRFVQIMTMILELYHCLALAGRLGSVLFAI